MNKKGIDNLVRIFRKRLEKTVFELFEKQNKPKFVLSLDNISDDEIIDACYDYETYKPLFFKFAPERVYESKFVEDLEELKRQLSAKYGLKDWQIGVNDYNDVGVEQAAMMYKHPNALEKNN